jgi:hypothetical protein
MKWRSVSTILLVATLALAMIYPSTRAAYAHNFTSDESASYLAKVQEITVEAGLVQPDLGNATTLQWHLQRLTALWTSYDTSQMTERNQLLSKEIPGTIANITFEAMKPNHDSTAIGQFVNSLDGYMNESISARVDQPKLQNLTVNALAIKSVLDEALNDYGNATGATMSLTNMSNMAPMSSNASMSSSSSSMQMSNTSAIVNFGAYESAQGMTSAATKMWSDLKAKTPSNVSSTAISALDSGFAKLKQLIDSKQSPGQVMQVVHDTIHPNFIILYNLQIQGEAKMGGNNGSGGMSGMSGGAGNNMTMSGGGMNMNASMSILEKKRIDYLKENAMQRHNEHLMGAKTTGSYKQNSSYMLNASGTGSPLSSSGSSVMSSNMSMSSSSGNTSVGVSLGLSVYESTPAETKLDIMNGTVTVGTNDVRTVQSGFAYYLPTFNKFIVVGFIPVKGADGTIQGVQLFRLWANLEANSVNLPSSATDSPLSFKAVSAKSYLGTEWMLQMTGTVAYSGSSSMNMG